MLDCVVVMVEHRLDQRKVDVDTLNIVKHVLAEVSSVSPLSEQLLVFETSVNTFIPAQVQHNYPHEYFVDTIYIARSSLTIIPDWLESLYTNNRNNRQ